MAWTPLTLTWKRQRKLFLEWKNAVASVRILSKSKKFCLPNDKFKSFRLCKMYFLFTKKDRFPTIFNFLITSLWKNIFWKWSQLKTESFVTFFFLRIFSPSKLWSPYSLSLLLARKNPSSGDDSAWKNKGDGVVSSQPTRVMDDRNGLMAGGGYVAR